MAYDLGCFIFGGVFCFVFGNFTEGRYALCSAIFGWALCFVLCNFVFGVIFVLDFLALPRRNVFRCFTEG